MHPLFMTATYGNLSRFKMLFARFDGDVDMQVQVGYERTSVPVVNFDAVTYRQQATLHYNKLQNRLQVLRTTRSIWQWTMNNECYPVKM